MDEKFKAKPLTVYSVLDALFGKFWCYNYSARGVLKWLTVCSCKRILAGEI
jgi:hypothetical protein